jgi:hypothetical protein
MTCIDQEPLDCIKKLWLALSITGITESGFALGGRSLYGLACCSS